MHRPHDDRARPDTSPLARQKPRPQRRLASLATLALAGAALLFPWRAKTFGQDGGAGGRSDAPPAAPATNAPDKTPSLDETRLVLEKWIDTQKLVSKERNDWRQGKEILTSRIDLVKREIAGLEEKIHQAQSSVAETNAKRAELVKQNEQLKATGAQLTTAVTSLEADVSKLLKQVPEPVRAKLEPLAKRIPDATTAARVTTAERFQNVIGILSAVNQANTEIAVNYEVRDLVGGKPAEVRVMYLGLAQAWYVSASGEAGVGRPSANGWTWTPDKTIANDVLTALEIVQGKHTPAYVPLPVKLQ